MSLLEWVNAQIPSALKSGWQSFGTATKWDANEKGQDIPEPLGTPIPGISGTVESIDPTWAGAAGSGNALVNIRSASGELISVGHVSPNVSIGQTVTPQDTIAFSGGSDSTMSSSPHIEFRVQPGGTTTSPFVNPVQWLSGKLGGSSSPILGPPAPGEPGYITPGIGPVLGPPAPGQPGYDTALTPLTIGSSVQWLPTGVSWHDVGVWLAGIMLVALFAYLMAGQTHHRGLVLAVIVAVVVLGASQNVGGLMSKLGEIGK